MRRDTVSAIALLLALTALALPADAADAPPDLTMSECLVLPPVGRHERSPIRTDAVEARIVSGAWVPPAEGDKVTVPGGSEVAWLAAKAGEDGWIGHAALGGGYAFWRVEADAERVMLLEASGHSLVYVNGEARAGDPYGYGFMRLPVALRQGSNDLLFFVQRGRVRAKLSAPPAPVFIDMGDSTLPDLVAGERTTTYAGVVVVNASREWAKNVQLRVRCDGLTNEYGENLVGIPVPPIPPLTCRKVALTLKDRMTRREDVVSTEFFLAPAPDGLTDPTVHTAELRVRAPGDARKVTFLSDIDGSVQYFGFRAAAAADGAAQPALFLTLHGASVEGIRQAAAYQPKDWGHVVAPTNRRPFGFDWEDWGRLDALEVLHLARRRWNTDPLRTYLTGHSMGGHGTWQLAAHYPDRFAAIAPSAGWVSFASYRGHSTVAEGAGTSGILQRAAAASDTLQLSQNYLHHGVYVLHGDQDDNVPVTEARTMRSHLGGYHADFVYYERPGAGHWWGDECMDWPPIFEFFRWHTIPETATVRRIEFATINPGLSSACHWAAVEAQERAMAPSSIRVRLDDKSGAISVDVQNASRLRLDLDLLPMQEGVFPWGREVTIRVGDQSLSWSLPEGSLPGPVWLTRADGAWTLSATAPSLSLKGPHRAGPFKDAFRHRMMFVYGTKGTDEENTWAAAKARYDAETWWYRGNGAVDVVRDVDFDPAAARDRGVVLYGHAEMVSNWDALVGPTPIVVRRGEVRVGDRKLAGDDLACMFLRPRPDSERASVAVIAGSGMKGLRLTDRMPWFVSGAGFPDCLVVGADMLMRGGEAVRAAGFFGVDWSVERGEFAFSE